MRLNLRRILRSVHHISRDCDRSISISIRPFIRRTKVTSEENLVILSSRRSSIFPRATHARTHARTMRPFRPQRKRTIVTEADQRSERPFPSFSDFLERRANVRDQWERGGREERKETMERVPASGYTRMPESAYVFCSARGYLSSPSSSCYGSGEAGEPDFRKRKSEPRGMDAGCPWYMRARPRERDELCEEAG